MKDLINKLYRKHSILYKLLLFIATTLLIAYLFPKNMRFKYEFEQGKLWRSDNLYAPFNFAIKKTDKEIALAKQEIEANTTKYFDTKIDIYPAVIKAYNSGFENYFKSIRNKFIRNKLQKKGKLLLKKIYENGFVGVEKYGFNKETKVVVLNNQEQTKTTLYGNLSTSETVRKEVENALKTEQLSPYISQLIAFYFDILEPNLILNTSLSDKVLSEQLSTVSNTYGSVEKGTLIISKGEVVSLEKYRMLTSIKSDYNTQNQSQFNTFWIFLATILLIALTLVMLLLFLKKYRYNVYLNTTKVTFIFFNLVVQIVLTVFVINYDVKYLYVVPICISPLVLKAFFDTRLGLFVHIITVLLLGFIVPNSYEYMFIQISAGVVTILTVSELSKRVNLFITVAEIVLVYIVAYSAFYVIQEATLETIKLKTLGLFFLSGLLTLFVQPLIYVYERLFGLVSDVSLLELSDTNSKLLKELYNVAPGTFHHSLNVAHLAEAAANEIGANAMLVRVGALYHDIGKMKNPKCFTENQINGVNPHNELSPEASAKIIINHVIDGIEIAKKHNLPDKVIDFIRTHHGTSKVYYFYKKAIDENKTIVTDNYTYPGPKPFSKETAILMICDGVEAASKSLKEPTFTKIDAFVERIISKQITDNQFINADITFKEIQLIKKVLKSKLSNIYHLRIEYPE